MQIERFGRPTLRSLVVISLPAVGLGKDAKLSAVAVSCSAALERARTMARADNVPTKRRHKVEVSSFGFVLEFFHEFLIKHVHIRTACILHQFYSA